MFSVVWDNDEDYTECKSCSAKFNFLLRKHHCRHCGKIFCIDCLTYFYVFNKPHYVCYLCHNQLINKTVINKSELHNLQNIKNKYTKMLSEKKNIHTQTYEEINPKKSYSNEIKHKINETLQNKSKSLDIIDCINNVTKNKKISSQEQEILKYQENKNKRYFESLKQREKSIIEREQHNSKMEKDLIFKIKKYKSLINEQLNIQSNNNISSNNISFNNESNNNISNNNISSNNISSNNISSNNISSNNISFNNESNNNISNNNISSYNISFNNESNKKDSIQNTVLEEQQKQIKENLIMDEKKLQKIVSTRDAVLKRKMDKKQAEQENYMNELKNIQNNYKNEIKKKFTK